MELSDYYLEDYLKQDVHSIVNKHKLVHILPVSGYHYWDNIERGEVNLNYDVNLIYVFK